MQPTCVHVRSTAKVGVGTAREAALLLKRPIDVVAAGVALIVLWPALLLITLLIKLDSPGPVLYRQARHGRHERVFTLVKFRTLRIEFVRSRGGPVPAGDARRPAGDPGGTRLALAVARRAAAARQCAPR